ncbi:MAG: glycosyltransferase family 39 protein [Terracidiphilus sp.]
MNRSSELPPFEIDESSGHESRRGDNAALLGIAAAIALLHLLTNNRYGFHRDELQFLSDARHLDWGFVAYPPLTPFLERIGLALFGLSMLGLRLFSVLGQALAIVVAGLMARELGGGRLAQVTTAAAVALSPLPLFNGTEFQYTSFDFVWWVLIAYFSIRLLKSQDPRWWLAIGALIGVGLETKYTVCFLALSLVIGVLLSPSRRLLLSRWFAMGVALAVAIFLPNLVWQIRHDFISLHFLEFIHARDVRWGRGDCFWLRQLVLCANTYSTPLWIAGIWLYLRSPRFRPMAWMYLLPAAFFTFTHAVFYYLAPAYPMLIAMGAVGFESWRSHLRRGWAVALTAVLFVALLGAGAYAIAIIVPLEANGPLRSYALAQNEALREEIGWNELVKTVAQIRDSLPPVQRANLGITTGNYGEYGAIEMLGPAYGLPKPIGTTNSEWFRGYPTPQPTTVIVIGLDERQANAIFTGCRWAGHDGNSEGIKNEESQYHPDIFVCGPPRDPWPEIWRKHRDFG